MHSTEFKFDMYITGHPQTNSIDFGESWMDSFFYRSTKKNSYTLRPMDSNYKRSPNVNFFFRFSSNLIRLLSITVLRVALILESLIFIILLQGH